MRAAWFIVAGLFTGLLLKIIHDDLYYHLGKSNYESWGFAILMLFMFILALVAFSEEERKHK